MKKSALNSRKSKNPLEILHSVKPDHIEFLKAGYINKGLDKIPDTFILYRIIGNDLYPRHKKGQSRENLEFTLKKEPELENCEKKWIVNRIIDKEEERLIIELLRQHNQKFIHLPFKEEEYKSIGMDTECLPYPGYLATRKLNTLGSKQRHRLITATYRLKNNYVMNNNGARNTALRNGKPRAKWILPWDGNCFVTLEAWKQIRSDIIAAPFLKYFVVPMARVVENEILLTNQFSPKPISEPQLIFRTDSEEEFNEDFCYGHRPKVELFWRLGIPGKWDTWKDDPWDQPRRPESIEARQFGVAGWVARMSSGMIELDKDQDNQKPMTLRSKARREAIISTLRNIDIMVFRQNVKDNDLSFFQTDILYKEKIRYQAGEYLPPVNRLIAESEEALKRGPNSVIDKKTLPPSGNRNDYWHPAPYWWPNPDTKNGLPYIYKDGERIPGTRMYEPESDKYDRTRLQLVFDDSITLALAWYFTGEKKYAQHGAQILERFFVNPATRMTPHLLYAQVVIGRKKNIGLSSGIIEMKDIYYYLDAVRLLESANVLTENTLQIFKEWLTSYLGWLIGSAKGKRERSARNNHGTYYDLQVAAIADFLDKPSLLFETLVRAQSRIAQQFAPDGSQPEELKRTTAAHYCCFNLQGWIYIADLASSWGINLWSYEATNGASLIKGANWLLSHVEKTWPYQQIDKFDIERFFPIWFAIPPKSIELPTDAKFPSSKYMVKPIFFPYAGVRPYWNLGLSH